MKLIGTALERDVDEAARGMPFSGIVAGGLHPILADEFGRGCIRREADAVIGRTVETILDRVQRGSVHRDSGSAAVIGVDVRVNAGY